MYKCEERLSYIKDEMATNGFDFLEDPELAGYMSGEELEDEEEGASSFDLPSEDKVSAECPEPDDVPEPDAEPKPKDDHLELGRRGELAARRYLEARGYLILETNWRCRYGEADIICMEDDCTVCFVEVKTRRGTSAGFPEEAVNEEKRKRYERIALQYLLEECRDEGNYIVRFDCIGICVNSRNRAVLRHHKGCFNGRS